MSLGSIFRVWLPLLAGLWILGFVFLSGRGPHDLVRWIGLLVALLGLGGVILARHTLGEAFSVAPKATILVTNGIYSRIRNPIYVSGVILLLGIALMLHQPYLLALLLVVVPMQIVRARKEARVLETRFGFAYREYRARTWF